MIKTVYETSDGTQFDNFDEAVNYENNNQKKPALKQYTVIASFKATKVFNIEAEDECEAEWLLQRDIEFDDLLYLDDVKGIDDIEDLSYTYTNDEGEDVTVH